MPAHHFHANSFHFSFTVHLPHTHPLPIGMWSCDFWYIYVTLPAHSARAMGETVKLHTKQRYCTGRNAEVDGDIFKFKGESDAVGVVKTWNHLADAQLLRVRDHRQGRKMRHRDIPSKKKKRKKEHQIC